MDNVLLFWILLEQRNAMVRSWLLLTLLEHMTADETEVMPEVIRLSIPEDNTELFLWIRDLLSFLSLYTADRVLTGISPLFGSVQNRIERLRILLECRTLIKEGFTEVDLVKRIALAKAKV